MSNTMKILLMRCAIARDTIRYVKTKREADSEGALFYHEQYAEFCAKDKSLNLAYGSMSDTPNEDIAKTIVDHFAANGVDIDWDDDTNKVMIVEVVDMEDQYQDEEEEWE